MLAGQVVVGGYRRVIFARDQGVDYQIVAEQSIHGWRGLAIHARLDSAWTPLKSWPLQIATTLRGAWTGSRGFLRPGGRLNLDRCQDYLVALVVVSYLRQVWWEERLLCECP